MDKIHQIVLGLLLYNIIGATAQSPTTLQITDFTATSITVIWDPIVADNYEIVFYESKSGEMHVIDNIDQGATTYFISNLNPGTMYQSMTIHAMYAGVPGPQSNVVDQLTLAPAPYVQVEDVGETTITISWNALPVAEKFFINYEEYNTGISHSLTVPGTASTYELIGLKPSTLYVGISVQAKYPDVSSDFSNEVQQTTEGGAVASGDPHMTTFDGRRYSFQGACWYTFFKDCTTHPDFEVTIKFEKRDDIELFKTRTVSFKVTVRDQYAIVNGMDVVKGSTGDGHVDSTAIQIQEKDSMITLTFTAKDTTYTLTWTMRKHILEASFSGSDYNGKLCGLMGDADGDKHNDFKKPDGTSTNDAIQFGESWKVNEEVCN